MVDPSQRLRRAIHLGSLSIVQRILSSNSNVPSLLHNYDEQGNTSLHLAVQLGCVDIVTYLLESGHEITGTTRNLAGETALIVACQTPDTEPLASRRLSIVKIILSSTPLSTLRIADNLGLTPLSHAAKAGSTALISLLLSLPRTAFPPALDIPGDTDKSTEAYRRASQAPGSVLHPLLLTTDAAGNTPLHHASAFGHLKVARLLIDAGLSAATRNTAGWTPIEYSATVAAEVYLRNLMREQQGNAGGRTQSRAAIGGLGVAGRTATGGVGNGGQGFLSSAGKTTVKPAIRVVESHSDRSGDSEDEGRRASLSRARTYA